MRKLVASVAALVGIAAALASSAVAAPGNGTAAGQVCYKGAWKTFNRSDGSPFRNQGDCVSYVAQGGAYLFISGPSACPTSGQLASYATCYYASGGGLRPNQISGQGGGVSAGPFNGDYLFVSPPPSTDANGAIAAAPILGLASDFCAAGFALYVRNVTPEWEQVQTVITFSKPCA